jgi:hypothetical protein
MLAAQRCFGSALRPSVQFPASRRKTVFGETPNTTRGTRMLSPDLSQRLLDSARNRETRNAHQTQRIVSFFGPCAPSTRIRSISPVRLGPVMNEMKLG